MREEGYRCRSESCAVVVIRRPSWTKRIDHHCLCVFAGTVASLGGRYFRIRILKGYPLKTRIETKMSATDKTTADTTSTIKKRKRNEEEDEAAAKEQCGGGCSCNGSCLEVSSYGL